MASIFAIEFNGSIPDLARQRIKSTTPKAFSGIELNELIELVRLED
jgi:hypothetical protein